MDDLSRRFWAKVDKDANGCWLWTASKTADGYGRFRVRNEGAGQKVLAHRFAYQEACGPIPDGLQLDHLCRVRACCNPAHLEPVTGRVNTLRGETIPAMHAQKTHCKRGHELVGDNLFIAPSGERVCRECRRGRQNASLGRIDPEERRARQREATRRYRARLKRPPVG